jgi:hypothetical protein
MTVMMIQFTVRDCNLPKNFLYRNEVVQAATGSFEDQNLDLNKNWVGDKFLIYYTGPGGPVFAQARITALEASYRLGRKYTDIFYSDFTLLPGKPPERLRGPGTTRYVNYQPEKACALT